MVSPNANNPERMKYAILGEDTSSVEEKLEKYTGRVGWGYLRPHFLRSYFSGRSEKKRG